MLLIFTASSIKNEVVQRRGPGARPFSTRTVRRRLNEAGLKARHPLKRLRLLHRHRISRFQWATCHQWTQRQWNRVLFSDESRFKLHHADGRVRVYRRQGERLNDNCILESEAYGGGSLMVWGGISFGGRTELVFIDGNLNSQRYVDEILRTQVIPYIGAMGNGAIFQDDNARPHRGRIALNFLEQNGVETLEWPALSPDMSPIEHLWDVMEREIRKQITPNTTLQELRPLLQCAWQQIPQHQINRLICSMRARIGECLATQGGHKHY